MLTHLRLTNFKIWQTTGAMRLAPLTILLGTNSSGKSSIIQSLLLIRQTVNGSDPSLDLNLGNPDEQDTVTLGQFKDLLCRYGVETPGNPANQVGIEFRWADTCNNILSTLFSARYRKGPAGSAELEFLRLGLPAMGFSVQRRKPGIYRLQLGSKRISEGQSALYRPQRSFAFSAAAIAELGERGAAIASVGTELLDELSKIIYLGPVRRLAQRDYVWAGRMPSHIGDDGGKAVDALIASGIAFQLANRRRKPLPTEANLFNETIYWLKAMNLADGLFVKVLGNSARYELLIENQGEISNLKDVGVGVSQVLPVIVAALFAEPGHIVIVEEPESHLHPSAQSQLADLFSQVSQRRGVQFIVETHSEHLLTRLQRRIAEEQIPPTSLAMYFTKSEGKIAKLDTLQLDEYGEITNWPENFFGDEMAEISARTIAAMKRKIGDRKNHNDSSQEG